MEQVPETITEPVVPKYNLNPEQEKNEIVRHYRALLRGLRPKLKKGDKELVRQAFEMAANAHKTMRRKSGEPYILHPIAVAMICVEEIGLGVRSTICALLHDTVEDTDIHLDDIQREFGSEIAKIVDGLTKISTVMDTNTSQQAENFKKILLTLTDDPRVILIKLADRLHNMRTLDSMKREKQLKIASETVWVYAPLAHRMGLYNIKTELEDLSMKYMEPEAYREIARKLSETKRERTRYINEFIRPLKEKLSQGGFTFEIYGRPKSIHSIWNKIKKKSVAFEEVYDLFAIRVILDSPPEKEKEDCWKVYSMITDEYSPSPERLRDWLSNPKNNGYEALHTTVMGPQGKWVEVQIRTKRMNEIAEKGLAAHYKYKEGSSDEDRFDKWFGQIREVLSTQDTDGVDFLQDFKTSFLAEEIYVYTPKGEVKMLPTGSTALDFAFSIHSAIGTKCIGAKVHHRLVPISHKLRSGDQVEIITSNKQKPSEDWLGIVVTAKAKNKIKDALREEKRKVAEDGKYTLQRKLESMGAAYSQNNIDELVQFYKLPSPLDLHYKIATKALDLRELKEFQVLGDKLEAPKPKPVVHEVSPEQLQAKQLKPKDSELIIFGESSDKIMYTLAKCCHPIPGDDVFGFVSTGKGLIIHRTNCPNAAQLMANYGHRVVKTKWAKNKEISFLTGLKIVGLDDVGVINKITNVISGDLRINIAGLTIESREGLFEGTIKVFVHDKEELEELVLRLKELNGIQTVDRFEMENIS
ncbi:MAG: bifunctional (p)ppGpp synthetase/guanosine-3',5'-bis(diphosphate) 3'-pyrophosphohydrolase [Chitinophagaceae bacterium]|nr:bifunctional (p)ppGpp synthetase/guanosine-3',5'-bis(diphosphate) 3'-pyrophosphohydrolase [Chitinophagaceae bacterium]MCA6451635.1 bifunctional (p)ppGpp synthetase/guanosine-3',5'-bis(diphosphate) 3'-pyrophosphohydrolase [Chitinophagaceae bacterium]MCA6456290.1 bifunctional (p)ppGpp synthetase/guanosine-3',5'-bis(diphosphate) 3'-pyrophosphohydrolase [Chitinophagaceae bacterium]MCA6460238.1 bifunctional (p)ppGpp synthetase/guanosine-3',5'-bis(diphosphate) 3'-pyrophosphohydrolase [Chitinophagac